MEGGRTTIIYVRSEVVRDGNLSPSFPTSTLLVFPQILELHFSRTILPVFSRFHPKTHPLLSLSLICQKENSNNGQGGVRGRAAPSTFPTSTLQSSKFSLCFSPLHPVNCSPTYFCFYLYLLSQFSHYLIFNYLFPPTPFLFLFFLNRENLYSFSTLFLFFSIICFLKLSN